MQLYGRYRCGAAIINKNYAVSAAHCTINLPFSDITLRSGSDNRSNGILTRVSDIKIHPSYNPRNYENDVCILKVITPFRYTKKVFRINLPMPGQLIPEGAIAKVTGFGAQNENGFSDDRLRVVAVPIMSQVICNTIYKDNILWNMICAGFVEGGRDSCQGDSGGPLVRNRVLIGIVSWGYGCARPNYPGVYARVGSPNINFFIKSVSRMEESL